MADVTQATSAGAARMSSLRDFVTGPPRTMPAAALADHPIFPYIIDIARGRTLYVPGLDAQKLREAPFANVYAKQHAAAILSVPWEAGPIVRPRVDTDPIYVFSSGRCGSTLLHNILLSAKILSISEPHVGGALISPAYGKYPPIRPLLRWVTRTFARDLMSVVGSNNEPLVVKLRSQFCRVPHLLLRKSRERRTIFMTRRFESWAKSVGQLFRVTPAYLVANYRQSIECYAYLRQHGDCHFLRYEDLIEQPRERMTHLSEFLGRDISRAAIEEAMRLGSQKGTGLERASEQGLARWEAIKDDAHRLFVSSGTADFYNEVIET